MKISFLSQISSELNQLKTGIIQLAKYTLQNTLYSGRFMKCSQVFKKLNNTLLDNTG